LKQNWRYDGESSCWGWHSNWATSKIFYFIYLWTEEKCTRCRLANITLDACSRLKTKKVF